MERESFLLAKFHVFNVPPDRKPAGFGVANSFRFYKTSDLLELDSLATEIPQQAYLESVTGSVYEGRAFS